MILVGFDLIWLDSVGFGWLSAGWLWFDFYFDFGVALGWIWLWLDF